MAAQITVYKDGLEKIRELNPLLVSYNIEMAEVTGGTFWKAYTKEQVAGTEIFKAVSDDVMNMMQVYPPVDLYEKNIRQYAKALGECYIRVSGTWNTTTYIDFDGHTNGKAPEGYRSVLTKEQWTGVLDFVKAVNGKLLISVANCEGNHHADELWNPEQAKMLLDYSRDYGVPVNAVEFTNEPNAYNMTGTPKGYKPEDFGRDQDYFFEFIKENYPEIKTVGPSACFDAIEDTIWKTAQEIDLFKAHTTASLLDNCKEKADIFSYHCYYGLSDRGAAFADVHVSPDQAMSEEYLSVIDKVMNFYGNIRDNYLPGTEMWVTEAADAGCGGNSWAGTCMEMVRSADEIGRFTGFTRGILFHNTLAASAYGYLDQNTHLPNPQYWVAYLWKKLVGNIAYDSKEEIREGAHVYAYSRKDGKNGYAYVMINNSQEESVATIPGTAEVYQLSGESLRSVDVLLNGEKIICTKDSDVPQMKAMVVKEALKLPAASVSFVLV